MTTSLLRSRMAAAGAALVVGLMIAGCSGSGGDDASSDAGSDAGSDVGSDAGSAAADVAEAESVNGARPGRATSARGDVDPLEGRALVKKGSVSLRADDVDRVRFDVTTVATENGGEVAQDSTETDQDGDAERARLTLRVPESSFQTVMDALEAVDGADLVSLTATTEDVSTQVIDTDVRVRLAERSIDRISLLLERARSIRDVVRIESELSRREADLGSLQQRQAFLADQTSMATIEVAIQRPASTPAPPDADDDETGFLAGLARGWEAFRDVTTGLLTGAGATLPFAVVALVVGLPLWVLARRRRPVATDTHTG